MTNFYQLLAVDTKAPADEIKRAFRTEIARYHPDKVQHLGKEFQEMAAARAAQLTEAYRTLMNPELRSEYDRVLAGPGAGTVVPSVDVPPRGSPERSTPDDPNPAAPPRFASERASRDEFVQKATIARFRQAVAAELSGVEERPARGFELSCTARARGLFARGAPQRIAAKFVARVDGRAVQDAWNFALRAREPICVFVLGNGVAPASELAHTISNLRNASRGAAAISIIPVDLRDWSAHVPADAPPACKSILKRLREGAA